MDDRCWVVAREALGGEYYRLRLRPARPFTAAPGQFVMLKVADSIDPLLRRGGMSAEKRRVWFADQYRNPHESKHTMDEVLGWFDETGIDFVRGVPALRPDDDGLDGASLFERQPRGAGAVREDPAFELHHGS